MRKAEWQVHGKSRLRAGSLTLNIKIIICYLKIGRVHNMSNFEKVKESMITQKIKPIVYSEL